MRLLQAAGCSSVQLAPSRAAEAGRRHIGYADTMEQEKEQRLNVEKAQTSRTSHRTNPIQC